MCETSHKLLQTHDTVMYFFDYCFKTLYNLVIITYIYSNLNIIKKSMVKALLKFSKVIN